MAIWRVYKVYCLADSSLLRSRHVLTRRQTRSAWKYCFHSQREPLQPIKDPATPRRAPLVADLQWLQVLLTINGNSRILKWRYCTIFLAIFCGDILLHRAFQDGRNGVARVNPVGRIRGMILEVPSCCEPLTQLHAVG